MSALPAQLLRFGVVGTVGFLVDSSVLLVLTHYLAIAPLPARVLSFLVAATVTWKLNRHFTFAQTGSNPLREWGKYLTATATGGALNVLVYKGWISFTDTSTMNLVLGVAIGSIVAMSLNFLISKKLIFK